MKFEFDGTNMVIPPPKMIITIFFVIYCRLNYFFNIYP
jgi:hypothetical protein